ncbi:MAG: CD225/dispanin family protein [Clostridia bacterium]|nr:CD225/dispanin family protein [Clostridia bacterium]
MYSPHCDGKNEDSESENNRLVKYPYVNSHMLGSILVLSLCCCIPFGIPAVVFSSKSQNAIRRGEYNCAVRFSERALTFILLGWIFGILALILLCAAAVNFLLRNGYGYIFIK